MTAWQAIKERNEVREQRFPWGLGAILVLVIVGGIGFWLGSSSVAPVIVPVAAPAPAPVAPVTPVYPTYPAYVAPHGGGFPLIGLLFGLIALVFIVKIARRAAWAASHDWAGPAGGPGWGGAHGRSRYARHGDGHGWHDNALPDEGRDTPTFSV